MFLVMQVRYSCTGGMYVTASKDGAIRIWDGVNSSVVRSISGAHGSSEATSASFTKDQRYIFQFLSYAINHILAFSVRALNDGS